MSGCLTCRRRKVKCDGRSDICQRCEKLGLQCLQDGVPLSSVDATLAGPNANFTQAGHRRFRTSAACETCRKKKLKCDARVPSCSLCERKGLDCTYAHSPAKRPRYSESQIPEINASSPTKTNHISDASIGLTSPLMLQNSGSPVDTTHNPQPRPPTSSHHSETAASQGRNSLRPSDEASIGQSPHSSSLALQMQGLNVPSDQDLLPYLDSLLENIHPISCNNFLHPGCLCEGIDRAPPLLLLAICGSSSKFMPGPNSHRNGLRWVEEAKWLIMKSLDHVSTLTISAIQFLALHEVHEGEFTAAWNLIGIATRMALELQLQNQTTGGVFLEQECRRRLMWAVYVSELVFNPDKSTVCTDWLLDLPLPCNIWSFTQGVPCRTLTLRQLEQKVDNVSVQQATNHCAYVISILTLRRKIFQYIQTAHEGLDLPWLDGSAFATLCEELRVWKSNLPDNYAFVERSMFMFRVSRHLDIFLMIHAYYHQCGTLLFSIFNPDHMPSTGSQTMQQAPPDFLQHCSDEAASHARETTILIQRILKVEPEHLFRDPWFELCIWDSTLALLASIPSRRANATYETIAGESLRRNLHALRNTRGKIPLAKRVYKYCCAAIHDHGASSLAEIEPSESDGIELDRRLYDGKHDTFKQRYPFLTPIKHHDSPEWEQLYKTTKAGVGAPGGLATAESTPAMPPTQPRTHAFDLGPGADFTLSDEAQAQLLSGWPPLDDFQFWQGQQIPMSQPSGTPFTARNSGSGASEQRVQGLS